MPANPNPKPLPDCYRALANAVKSFRRTSGVSLERYAKRLGMSPATLSRIENGMGCDLLTLVRIQQYTKARYGALLGDSDG